MTIQNNSLPELLAPAGSPESLRAALAAGADAVYFGGTAFSNRMRARNFSDSEVADAVRLCRSAGANAHITVNIRVRDRELDDVLHFVDSMYSSPDTSPAALIVADFGIAREIHSRFPEVCLHASTQTSLCTPLDCEAIQSLGFSRLVIPRELSRDEIKALCEASPIEIEMFLHGAHCVSYSGQCLLSYAMGGRSGNRGECGGPCRLPFRVSSPANRGSMYGKDMDRATDKREAGTAKKQVETYPISLADMCLAGRITDVIDTGVCSLKLEGRMKSAAYVYGVTKIYRTLLDERRNAELHEIKALAQLFDRGFTHGYFSASYSGMTAAGDPSGKRKKPAHAGDGQADEKNKAAVIKSELDKRLSDHAEQASLPVCAEFTAAAGEETSLTLTLKNDPSVSVTAHGDSPELSDTGSLDREKAEKGLLKLGGTRYTLAPRDLKCNISPGLRLPVSSVNSLRRTACELMDEKYSTVSSSHTDAGERTELRPYIPQTKYRGSSPDIRTAEITDMRTLCGISDEFTDYFDTLYVPSPCYSEAAEHSFASKAAAVLPDFEASDRAVAVTLEELKALGCTRVMCHRAGQLKAALSAGFSADMSYRGNITNTSAYCFYKDMGADRVILSPELPAGAVKSIGGGAIVYGRLPLMTMARCVICGGVCKNGGRGGRNTRAESYAHPSGIYAKTKELCRAVLCDRMGEEFPVIGDCLTNCVNILYNAVPTWTADQPDKLNEIKHKHFHFTTESSSDAEYVVKAYKNGWKEERVRRI